MADTRPSYLMHTALLSALLGRLSKELAADPASASAWSQAAAAIEVVRAAEPELARIVDAKDAAALATLVAGWSSGATLLPEHDRATLKSAVKAFKKSLKVTRLDDESGIGGGAMSSGKRSGIVAIAPPGRFAQDVWDELVRQGKLVDARHGIYELRAGVEE